jgi:hypothetical protein
MSALPKVDANSKSMYFGRGDHATARQSSTAQFFITNPGRRRHVQSDRGEISMRLQGMTYLNDLAATPKPATLTGLMKRLGSGRFVRRLFKVPPAPERDPYLLVLLADQEFGEGHEEQAVYLIEAVYRAFDRQREITRPRVAVPRLSIVAGNAAVGSSTG